MGTGASHILELDAESYFEDSEYIYWDRTTFHPYYSYADFIGTYRPIQFFLLMKNISPMLTKSQFGQLEHLM